jgi:glyoxylase-like metal-dependent hydrolase (beta-lactamase superfamily II)
MGSGVAPARAHEFGEAGPGGARVTGWVVGPLQENCFLVQDPATGAGALVDPGADGDALVAALREREQTHGLRLEAVWLTHAHLDHVGALKEVTAAYRVPVYLHALDRPVFAFAGRSAAMYGLPWEEQPAPDAEYVDGEELALGDLQFRVLHTPGHAPGHVVIHGAGVLMAGDLLFSGSIGRTDLPMADPRAMTRSLARVAGLPRETAVYPGHGPATTIGAELRSNPFLNGGARPLGG